ncbi:MAG: hypothetical protein AABM67_17955 [Acidobacteriota bacterium]
MALTIPEPVVAGLTKIATLPEESFQELLAALEKIPLKIHTTRIFEDASLFEVKTLTHDEVKLIRDTLFPLYVGRAGTVPVSKYVDEVAESLVELKRDDLAWTQSAESLEHFENRLETLLSVRAIETVARAQDLQIEHDKLYAFSRVASQIRPVFNEDLENPPTAAIIEHMLTINYHDAGKRCSFVVALDVKDVEELAETLKRAEAKTESLKSIIASTGLAYIEVV